MLSFGLKIAWFSLSLSGLLGSWAATPAFIRITQSLCLPLVYSVVNTILQGIFCLGLIWRLDPPSMSLAFCEAQAALIHASWTCIASICLLCSLSTANLLYRGTLWASSVQSRCDIVIHTILLCVLPVVVLATQLATLTGLHVDIAADGMFCDASDPAWVRLVGYSGLVPLIAIPSLLLSASAGIKILGLRRGVVDRHDNFTPLPFSHRSRQGSRIQTPEDRFVPSPIEHNRSASAPTRSGNNSLRSLAQSFYAIPSRTPTPPAGRTYPPPGRARITVSTYKYHIPSYYLFRSSTSPNTDCEARRPSADLMTESGASNRSRVSSFSPIAFAPPSEAGSMVVPSRNPSRGNSPAVPISGNFEKASLKQASAVNAAFSFDGSFHPDSDDTVSGSIKWARKSVESSGPKSELEFARSQLDEIDDLSYPRSSPITYPSVIPHYDEPNITDTRQMILFSLFLSATLIISAITPLMEVITKRHVPFGTQNVGLLLIAWAPCVLFGVRLPRMRRLFR